MATTKGKPRGYFEKLLAIDCETTGLCFSSESPVYDPKTKERHQSLSWGMIVANAQTLEPIEKIHVLIRWNEQSKEQKINNRYFGKGAENIHGMSFQYLEKNGVPEEKAVEIIGNLIIKHWSPEVSIRTLGHNVITFDLLFLRDLFTRHGIELKFGNRHYDSNALAFGTLGTYNSDDMFSLFGFERKTHNALEDAELALEIFRMTRILWKSKVGLIHEEQH